MSFDFNLGSPDFGEGCPGARSVKEQVKAMMAHAQELQQLMAAVAQLGSLIPEAHRQQFTEQKRLPLAVVESLVPQRQAVLDQWWEQQSRLSLKPLTLASHLIQLMFAETRLKALTFKAWEAGIEALEQDGDINKHEVYLVAGDLRFRLPGVVASRHDLEQNPDAPADFLIYSLASGCWFDTERARAASALAPAFAEGSPLRWLLSSQERAALSTEGLTLDFVPLQVPLHRYFIRDLRAIQLKATQRSLRIKVDDARRLAQLDSAARLEPLVAALQKRATRHVRAYRTSLLPEWRRFMQGEELQAYRQLEDDLQVKEQRCTERLAQWRDLRSFAKKQVKQALGLDIDPEQVRVCVSHVDDPEQVMKHTLLDWALSGGYSGGQLKVEVLGERHRSLLGSTSIQSVIEKLDLRVNYVKQIRTLYDDALTMAALCEVLDARLALANQAARHQGFHPAGFDLLHHARQGNMQANAISAGLVCLNGAQTPLKDLLCLVQGDQYLLYAPGAPGGDFHLFDSLQEMALEIGSWTLWPVGSEYLLGQCSRAQHDSLKRHLRKVEMLPTDWTMHSVTLAPIKSQQWPAVLKALARRKIIALIEDQQATTPSWFINASRAEQQALVDIDQLLKLAQARYQSLMKMPSFRTFAHRQVTEKINSYPGNRGGPINPDQVLITLEEDAIRTLTQTVIKGYPTYYNFSDFARITSATGQDISHLSPALLGSYIRAADLGTKYIEEVKAQLLDRSRPEYERLRQCYRTLFALKIRRAVLSEKLQGSLSGRHAQWLESVIDTFSGTSIDATCNLYPLWIDDCPVQGAYLLKHARDRELEPLVYLPEIEQGPTLRTLSELARTWREHDLAGYCQDRVPLSNQSRLNAWIEEQLRAGDGIELVLDAVARGRGVRPPIGETGRIGDPVQDLEKRIRRMINEAAEDSADAAERISAVVVEWGIVLAGILTVPFPPAAMAVGLFCAARSFVTGAIAWSDGDRSAALLSFAAGVAGTVASTGVLARLFGAAQKYITVLSRAEVSQPTAFSRVIGRLCDDYGDLVSEVAPALYDGFSQELLWLVEEETQDVEAQCGLPA